MSFERRSYSGASPATSLQAGISSADGACDGMSGTGYPDGSGGPFSIVIGRGLANEEKILVSARSATTFTFLSRGYDGTSPSLHAVGETIEVCATAIDFDEANAHITDDTRDDHSQYLKNSRHDITARHVFGAALPTPAAPAAIGTANATGVAAGPPRADHVHKIGNGAINAGAMFAAGVVPEAAIAAGAIDAAHLQSGIVNTANIVDGSITGPKMAAVAVDTGNLIDNAVRTAKIADGNVTTAKIPDGAVTRAKIDTAFVTGPTAYTPTLNGWTKGNGTVTGEYSIINGWVFWTATFTQGSTSDMSAQGGFSMPVALDGSDWSGSAKFTDVPGGNLYYGGWVATSTTACVVKVAGAGDGNTGVRGDTAKPFAWSTGDSVTVTGMAKVA